MAVKKEETEVAPAASAVVATPAAPRRMGGAGIAGIVIGSVLVAGALFGGGVLVGTHLPQSGGFTHGQFGDRGGFPGGPNGFGGPGPVRPGQQGQQQDDGSTQN